MKIFDTYLYEVYDIIMRTKLKTTKDLTQALGAYKIVSSFSDSELETLEILFNQKDKDLILQGMKESKTNKVHPIRSIL